MSGRAGKKSPVSARWTQSVGVPPTAYRFAEKRRTRTAECKVSDDDAPDLFSIGATTKTAPKSAHAAANAARPGASMPSSLVAKMLIISR